MADETTRQRTPPAAAGDPATLQSLVYDSVQQLADGIFVCTPDGQLLYVNQAAAAQVGRAANELTGRHLSVLFDEPDRQRVLEIHRAIVNGSRLAAEILLADGVHCEVQVNALTNGDGSVVAVCGVTRDVSRRWQAEQRLKESQLELQMRSTSLAVESAERHRLAEAYRQLVDASLQGIVIIQDDRLAFANPAAARMVGYSRRELLRMDGEAFRRIIDSGDRAAVLDRLRRRLAGEELPPHNEIRIHRKDGSLCWLELYASVIELHGRPAIQAAIVDITGRKQREREQDAVLAVATALRSARNRSEMLPVILEQLSDLLDAEGALFAMVGADDGEAELELACGVWADATGDLLELDASLTGKVLDTGEPYLDNEARGDARFARRDLLDLTPAVLGVPLIANDVSVGVLWVGRSSDFCSADLRLLSAIAEMTANAIHRTTLFETTQRRVHHLDALHRIDRAITSSLDLQLIFDVLLDQVMQHLNVDAVRVLHRSADGVLLEPMATRGFRGALSSTVPVRIGEGLSGQVASRRRSLMVGDLRDRSEPGSTELFVQAENFVAYIGVPLLVKDEVKGVLEVFQRQPLHPDAEWSGFLTALAGQAAVAIDHASLFDELQRSNRELGLAYDTTLEGWSRALEMRDRETQGHTERVSAMAVRLASALGIADDELIQVRRGALLHDIGKMGIPDRILLKEGPLSEAEWKIMRRHPSYARELLDRIEFLRPAIAIPWCHHERWDGRGYPRGLAAEEIPLAARAFAVVDVWDALLSDRPYRAAWTPERTLSYLEQSAGSHFDPRAVEVFIPIIG